MHRSVLLNEIVEALNLKGKPTPVVLDGTIGLGGHSAEICRLYPGVKIIALDQDQGALRAAKAKFQDLPCEIVFVNDNFRNLDLVLKRVGEEELDGMILDLGFSSDQLENSGRGFSFKRDEPLLMTMKENPGPEDLTAKEIVNTWSEENLATIIEGYGEERYAKRIARAVVAARERHEIATTGELVEILKKVVGRSGGINGATRTFQALRIAVNDELGALSEGLVKGFDALKKEGRLAVITFHSLEDRIVKKFFRQMEEEGKGKRVNKKVILASSVEIKENPRGRSAKLRILNKT